MSEKKIQILQVREHSILILQISLVAVEICPRLRSALLECYNAENHCYTSWIQIGI